MTSRSPDMPLAALLLVAFSLLAVGVAPLAAPAERGANTKTEAQKPDEGAQGQNEGEQEQADEEAQVEVNFANGRASVYAVKVDAHKVFTALAEACGFHIIVDDTVRREITVCINDMAPEDILAHIADANGFACSQVAGIWMVSEGIPKNPSSYLLSDIDCITTRYVEAPNAKSLLPVFLQDHVKTNPRQNTVILSAPPAVLRKFRQDIAQFDIPAAQIMIEVLVVEFTNMTRDEFAAALGLSNADNAGTLDSLLGQLTFQTITGLTQDFFINLKALITKGRARVRAAPRIATVSGQKASIFIGVQQFLSTPVTMPDEEQANSIDAGVSLEMTPYTGGEGEIIAEIAPEVSTLTAPDPKTGLPDRTSRRAKTVVHVRDGETIIIGGLSQHEVRQTRGRIPVLDKIPLIGPLFRSKHLEEINTELAIFITPRTLSQTGHLPDEEEQRLKARFLPEQAPTKREQAEP